jgi:hypothetical protein
MTVNGQWGGSMPAGHYKATVRPGDDPQTKCAVASPVVAFFELDPKDAQGSGWVTIDTSSMTITPVTSNASAPITATYKGKPAAVGGGTICGATAVLRESGTGNEVHQLVTVHTNVADTMNMLELWKHKYSKLAPGEYGLTIAASAENASIVSGPGKVAEACLGKMGNIFHVTGGGTTAIAGVSMSTEYKDPVFLDDAHTNVSLTPMLEGSTACRYTGRVRVNYPNTTKDITEHYDFTPGKTPDTWTFRIPNTGGDPALVQFWSSTEDTKDGHKACAGSFSKTIKLWGKNTFQ